MADCALRRSLPFHLITAMIKLMYKLLTTCCLLLLSTFTHGQTFSDTVSEQHQLIPGTNVFMIPPPAFAPSPNFKGFQNPADQSSMLMLVEIPGPFSEGSKGFTEEEMAARGMKFVSEKDVSVSGIDGVLIEMEQTAPGGMEFSKCILAFGDNSSTMLINGACMKDSLTMAANLKKSLFSTVVNAELKANPRNGLNFTLDETAGDLKFHSVIGNGMLFNRDLKIPTESEDKAILLADKSFVQMEIADKKAYCLLRLKKYPEDFMLLEEKGLNEIEVDGLKGYELYAVAESDKTKSFYQVILFDDNDSYYIFAGAYATGMDKAVVDFKKVISTFKRR